MIHLFLFKDGLRLSCHILRFSDYQNDTTQPGKSD